ncbi:phosphate ABC transporter substrate-binding protein PstS family protein [candidate division KSB1 bacterium]|nr:phosphate ABC transporter substrate-binding protein PstS family protein [candidate division KSB1 bacterium]
MRRLVTIFLLFFSCGSYVINRGNVIRISGSDTMRLLVSKWAAEFREANPGIDIRIKSEGTANGIRALISGKADICAASRPLRAAEVRTIAEKYNKIGMSTLVAKDALSIYINPENPLRNLTLDQLEKIFQGEVTNWSAVGGLDEPILVLTRSSDSGTYLYFREHILGGDSFTDAAVEKDRTAEIVATVLENRNAIGYGGLAYGEKIIHCYVNGVAPTIENVKNDSYPIIRYLYLFTIEKPQGIVKQFIDWVLKDGQKIVDDVGYIPLW